MIRMKYNRNIQWLAFLLFVICFSCMPVKYDYPQIDGYDLDVCENGKGLDQVSASFIPLENTIDGILDSPKKIVKVDTSFIVSDIDRVVMYSEDGKVVRPIGCKGHGFGEYINVSTFYVDEKQNIILCDSYKNSLMKFDKRGKFVEERKLNNVSLQYVQNICPISEDLIFIYDYLFNDNTNICRIVDLRKDTEEVVFTNYLKTADVMMPVGYAPCGMIGGKLVYLRPFDDKIHNIDGSVDFSINTSMRKYTENEIKDISDFGIGSYAKCLEDNVFMGFTDIFETEKYIMLACKNINYILIDKESQVCRQYDYGFSPQNEGCPLYNIRGSHGNQLYGFLSSTDAMALSQNQDIHCESCPQSLTTSCDNFLVIYDFDENN